MSKKKHEEEEHENSERWLLTYADLITLLLALFIILYSMSQVDQQKYEAVAEVLREKMGDQSGYGTGATADAAEYTLPPGDIISDDIDINGSGKGTALEKVYDALQQYVSENGLQDTIEVSNTNNYVRIQIKDKLMFIPDSSRLIDPDNPILMNIQKAVSQVYDEVDYITFAGHTADLGIGSLMSDQTSWRLSTERAITVLNEFIGYGLPQNKLAVEGYAHFSPIADNSTEEGKAQNRRVDITIYKNPPIIVPPPASATSTASEPTTADSATAAHGNAAKEEPAVDAHGNPVKEEPAVDAHGNPVKEEPAVDAHGNPIKEEPAVDAHGNPINEESAASVESAPAASAAPPAPTDSELNEVEKLAPSKKAH